jgi:hypothetical protein
VVSDVPVERGGVGMMSVRFGGRGISLEDSKPLEPMLPRLVVYGKREIQRRSAIGKCFISCDHRHGDVTVHVAVAPSTLSEVDSHVVKHERSHPAWRLLVTLAIHPLLYSLCVFIHIGGVKHARPRIVKFAASRYEPLFASLSLSLSLV